MTKKKNFRHKYFNDINYLTRMCISDSFKLNMKIEYIDIYKFFVTIFFVTNNKITVTAFLSLL